VGEHNYTNCRGDHTGELAQLVGRVAGGDRVAEGELYRRLSAKVVYWARRYTDSPDDAEDLASDSWELLLGKLRGGALREPSRVTSYCMGVVRRIAATRRRPPVHASGAMRYGDGRACRSGAGVRPARAGSVP
jgi:DNA-directed RNA polymerase specialized sigma24 family protein